MEYKDNLKNEETKKQRKRNLLSVKKLLQFWLSHSLCLFLPAQKLKLKDMWVLHVSVASILMYTVYVWQVLIVLL